jgi:hypothetical protein
MIILYLWVTTGLSYAHWEAAGTFPTSVACHTAAYTLRVSPQEHRCIKVMSGEAS